VPEIERIAVGCPPNPTDHRIHFSHCAGVQMTVQLDHFIVPSRDAAAAAQLLGEILAVRWARAAAIGPFSPVFVNDGLTLDFQSTTEAFPIHHYCFRVGRDEFDAIIARLRARAIPFRSTVEGPVDNQVGAQYGNAYWNEPDGHYWEVLTSSYAREA
jgi:hypothetical protein